MRVLTGFLGHDNARRVSSKDLVACESENDRGGSASEDNPGRKASSGSGYPAVCGRQSSEINPAVRVTIDVKTRAGKSKRGFDDAEAANILAAAQEADPVNRWVPLLSAYSGVRVSEICQLGVEDVTQLSGIWCMKIAPEAGSLKTAGSERVVPLHPAVIEAGFLQFVATASSKSAYRPRQRGHIVRWRSSCKGSLKDGMVNALLGRVGADRGWQFLNPYGSSRYGKSL